MFFGGIGFHFFGIIHWLSLSTPSPWRVSHLVFLSTSTTRTNQINAVVAVRLPQSSKGHKGVGVNVVPNVQKKTNLLMDSVSGRCGSHREFCAGNQDVQNLAVKSRRFRLGCFWMLFLCHVGAWQLLGFLPSTTRPICLEVGPSNSRTGLCFHAALQREASLEDGSVTGFSSVTLLLMLVRSWVSTGSEVNYEFVFCLETSIKFNVQLFEFIVLTLDPRMKWM